MVLDCPRVFITHFIVPEIEYKRIKICRWKEDYNTEETTPFENINDGLRTTKWDRRERGWDENGGRTSGEPTFTSYITRVSISRRPNGTIQCHTNDVRKVLSCRRNPYTTLTEYRKTRDRVYPPSHNPSDRLAVVDLTETTGLPWADVEVTCAESLRFLTRFKWPTCLPDCSYLK